MDYKFSILIIFSTILLINYGKANEVTSGGMGVPGNSNDMKPGPSALPTVAKPGMIGKFLTPPARPQHRLSLLNVYKPKDIDYDEVENTNKGADNLMKKEMIKSPMENMEGMKQALADLTKMPLEVADELKEGTSNMMKMPLEKAEVLKQSVEGLMKLPLEVTSAMKQAADDLMQKAEDLKQLPMEKLEDAKEASIDLLKLPLEKAEEIKTESIDLMKQSMDALGTIKEGAADLLKAPTMESMPEVKPNVDDELKEMVDKLVQPKLKDEIKKMITDLYGEKAVLDLETEFKKAVGLMAAETLKGDMKNEIIIPIIEPVTSTVPDDVAELVEKLVQPKMREDIKSIIINMYGEKAVQDIKNEFKRAVGIMAAEGMKDDMKMMLTNILSENMVNDIKADLTEAIPDLMKGSPQAMIDMKENVKEALMDLVEQGMDSKPDIPMIAIPPTLPSKDGDETESMGMKQREIEKMGMQIPEKNAEMGDPAAKDLNVSKPSPPTSMGGGGDSKMNSTSMDMGNSTKKIILVDKVDKDEAIAESVLRILNMGPWRGRRHWQYRSGGPMSQSQGMRFKSHERMGTKWGKRWKRAVSNRPVLRRPNLRNELENYPPPARLRVPMFTTFRQINSAAPPDPYKRSKDALSLPLLSINEPALNIILDDIKEGLQYALQTRNDMTLPIHGTGTTAGNALIDNLVEPGDVVLAAINGYWTELMANMSQRYDAHVIRYNKPPGTIFSPREIETALQTYRPKILLMTQGESSTTVFQPLDEIGPLCQRYGVLLVVDVVAVAGIQPVRMDEVKVDAAFTSSHKGFGGVVGLGVVSLSERAVAKIRNRRTPPRAYQTDILSQARLLNTSGDASSMRFQSLSVALLYALREALATIAEERMENTFRRHVRATEQLNAGATALGLEHYVENPRLRLIGITAFKMPEGKDALKIEQYMWRNHNIEISIGFGPTARRVLRLATFASNADPRRVQNIIEALRAALNSPETNL